MIHKTLSPPPPLSSLSLSFFPFLKKVKLHASTVFIDTQHLNSRVSVRSCSDRPLGDRTPISCRGWLRPGKASQVGLLPQLRNTTNTSHPQTNTTHTEAHTHAHTFTRIHARTHTHIHTHSHTHSHTHTYTQTYTHTHAHARARTHTHTHTHTQTPPPKKKKKYV